MATASTNVFVAESSVHGHGLFAGRSFSEGELILEERPLLAMQDLRSRCELLCCGRCLAELGHVEESVRRRLAAGEVTRRQVYDDLDDKIACLAGCGELYCSEACRESDEEVHGPLCVGAVAEADAETHPLVAFKELAVQSNEILLLAAQVVVRGEEEQNKLKETFVHERWDDVVAKAAELQGQLPDEDLCESLRDLTTQAAELLSSALENSRGSLVEPETVSRIVGMFEQNNVGIRRESEDEDLPALEGTALFALCCCANHSCEPSCDIIYDSERPTDPLRAQLVANRHIEKGEELSISYIDETDDIENRRAATAEYGFICECARCK